MIDITDQLIQDGICPGCREQIPVPADGSPSVVFNCAGGVMICERCGRTFKDPSLQEESRR